MLVLDTQQQQNMQWLSWADKYVEKQYNREKTWRGLEITRKEDFDDKFYTEYDFICTCLSYTLNKGTV